MIKTDLTMELLDFVQNFYGDKKDECGKLVIERLMWVAEHMSTEITICTALLQDYLHDSVYNYPTLSTELPESVRIAMNTLLYCEDQESYTDYIDRILENSVASKVKLFDLEYRSNTENYDNITTHILDQILLYRSAYWRVNSYLLNTESEVLQFEETDAIKTPCCNSIIQSNATYCSTCGKEIDKKSVEHLKYGFDKYATGRNCSHCGFWVPMTYRFCPNCGKNLNKSKKLRTFYE